MTSRMPNTSVRPTAMSAYTMPMVTPFTTCCRTTAVTRGARAGSHELKVAHRAPVGDGNRVELEVQLLAEVERNLLGALRLDDPAVLFEDDVFELLEDGVRLVEVVVLADQAIATAAIGGHRLRDEQIQKLLRTAPVHVDDDGVGHVQLVARTANRLLAMHVGEERVLRGALRLRALELV